MTKPLIRCAAIVVLGFSLPSLALADTPSAGHLRGSISVGTDIYGKGDLHGGTTSVVSDLSALNPGIPAVPATLNIRSRKYSDVYDAPVTISGELSYGVNDNLEVFGAVNYSKSDGSRIQVGTADVAALNATLPVFGEFGDLKNLGLEVGARYFFGDGDYVPFVGGSIGVVQQDALKASFTIPGAPAGGITIANVPFFKKTNSMTASVEGGIAMNFSDTLSGRISVGARYTAAFKGDDSALTGLGLQTINNGSERWTYPVKASLAASF
jgi:hypothetical protein